MLKHNYDGGILWYDIGRTYTMRIYSTTLLVIVLKIGLDRASSTDLIENQSGIWFGQRKKSTGFKTSENRLGTGPTSQKLMKLVQNRF